MYLAAAKVRRSYSKKGFSWDEPSKISLWG